MTTTCVGRASYSLRAFATTTAVLVTIGLCVLLLGLTRNPGMDVGSTFQFIPRAVHTGSPSVARLPITLGSPYADHPIRDTRARTRTGASIVAVIRHDEVISAPGPDFILRPGDTAIVVGEHAGVAAVGQILTRGSSRV